MSSDAGLLLIKEFISKLGIERLLNRSFKTKDSAVFRYHTDRDNLLQMIYMIIAGYFENDASDELTKDPVFKAVLEKSALASQPTVSRFFNPMYTGVSDHNRLPLLCRSLRSCQHTLPLPDPQHGQQLPDHGIPVW